ncbi:MAG: TldD/PmbA family protein [Planctomycetota bacterium]
MNRQELEERAEALLSRALDAGADAAEVFATERRSLSAKFEKGDLGQVQSDEGRSVGLRVIVDGRLGFTSTNQTSDASLSAAAAEAVAIARTSPPDEANVLPDASEIDSALLVGPRVDGALSGWSIEAAVEHAAELNRRAAAHDPRLSVDRASVSSIAGSTLVLSSRGVRAYDEDAAATLSLMALATDGDETGGFDYRGAVLRRAADLDEESARIAREVADACVGNLGAKPGKSYVGPVLFAPAAFATAFVGPFASALSGLAVQRQRSGLADKLGEIVAPGVRIVDDPGDLQAAGACAFDREGQPAQRRSLVEDGVLTTFLHNAYTGAVGGHPSTGHASGGARSTPGIGAHALDVAPASDAAPADESAALAALGTGLYVQRLSGSVDAASGDFSGAAKSARWVENGQVVGAVQEVMLSGNAFELLAAGPTLTRERVRLGGSSQLPWALVDGVSVTGA